MFEVSHRLKELPPEVLYEICLGVERVPQPEGDAQFNVRKAGDCFLCSSYAIIRHFCWAKGLLGEVPSMADVFEVWKSVKAEGGSTHYSNVDFWNQLNGELEDKGKLPFRFEMVQDPPFDTLNDYMTDCFGPKVFNAQSFKKRLKVYLEAGYLAHVQVQSEKTSSFIKRDATPLGSDHLVVIDGLRECVAYKMTCYENAEGLKPSWHGNIFSEIHIVDSSKKKPDAYWFSVEEFVKEHGGYMMYFVRPSRTREVEFPQEPLSCSVHVEHA